MEHQSYCIMAVLVLIPVTLSLFFSIPSKAIATGTPPTKPYNSWESLASMPTARASLGVAAAYGKIYAIGGSANDPVAGPVLLNVTEEYDPVTDTWATKAPMPTARHSFGVAVYENKIYCIGGSTNGPVLAENEVYDPATDTWQKRNPLPTARAALCANVVNGKIYLMGGNPGNTTNEVYDPVTDSWTTKAQIPIAAVFSESTVANNKIYLFGGLSNRSSTQIYDPATDTWAAGAPITVGVAEGAAAATTGVNAPVRIYVMGGETTYVRNDAVFGNITDLNQVYDPESDKWSMGASLPTELHYFGLANLNDTLYVLGGFPKVIDFLNTNYQYTPIGCDASGQEPASLLTTSLVVALVVTAVTASAVAVLIVILRKRSEIHKRRPQTVLLCDGSNI